MKKVSLNFDWKRIDGAKRILEQEKGLMAYLIYTDEKGELAVWYSPSLQDKIQ